MRRCRSRTDEVLDLIKKYSSYLQRNTDCYLLNDKLVEIIFRRFFQEYEELTGSSLIKCKEDTPFPLVLSDKNRLNISDDETALSAWDDLFLYFMEEASPFGYQMSTRDSEFLTFESSFLYFNESGESFNAFFLNVKQPLNIKELLGNNNFIETMQNVYNCWETYSIEVEVYINKMIPAARRAYRKHRNCRLFQELFAAIKYISSPETDTLYLCYETKNCWYSVFFYGFYNDYGEMGWYFMLPADMYLKRLFIDTALLELNSRYHFYEEK